jgi:hypothetical protein
MAADSRDQERSEALVKIIPPRITLLALSERREKKAAVRSEGEDETEERTVRAVYLKII